MPEPLNPKRASRESVDKLLDRVDGEADPARAAERKEPWRPYRTCPLRLSLREPGGTTRDINCISRNLSGGGISVVCNGYLHPGTECTATLTTIDNAWDTVPGEVRRCEYVGGNIHEVGIEFVGQIDLARFIPVRVSARILIVEDEKAISRMTVFILNKAEATTTTVETGERAVEMATSSMFDLILMDMMLPGIDGFAATEAIRAQGIETPIIAFTSLNDPSDRQRCLDAGCTDYLSKPAKRHELLQCVLSHLTTFPMFSSLSGDPEMEGIIRDFMDDLPALLTACRQCKSTNDSDGLLVAVRNLKAAAGMHGFKPISTAAQEVENILGNADDRVAAAGLPEPVGEKVGELLTLAGRARAGKRA